MSDYIFSTQEIRTVENQAKASGISEFSLIKHAAMASFLFIHKNFTNTTNVIILCGPGNNGNDGLALAKLLNDAHWNVTVYKYLRNKNTKLNSTVEAYYGKKLHNFENLLEKLHENEEFLIIDALFGIGLSKALPENLKGIFSIINTSNNTVIAIDIASGIDSNSGLINNFTLKANFTITFIGYKLGHFLYPGKSYSGKIILEDIGLYVNEKPQIIKNSKNLWPAPLTKEFNSNKYTQGHLIAYASCVKYSGAICLAMLAALKIGTGIIRVICSNDLTQFYSQILPYSVIVENNVHDITQKIHAFLIGPGLIPNEETKQKTISALQKVNCVIDAGATCAFQNNPQELFDNIKNCNAIITPHEGEFKKLFPNIQNKSKIEKALLASKQSGAIIVLKGSDTIIASPDGRIIINDMENNFNLSVAGTGDVLSGIIAGLLTQGYNCFEAAGLGVYIHSECAKQIKANLTAENLMKYIPKILFKSLKK